MAGMNTKNFSKIVNSKGKSVKKPKKLTVGKKKAAANIGSAFGGSGKSNSIFSAFLGRDRDEPKEEPIKPARKRR